jgi:hypothetical protein
MPTILVNTVLPQSDGESLITKFSKNCEIELNGNNSKALED